MRVACSVLRAGPDRDRLGTFARLRPDERAVQWEYGWVTVCWSCRFAFDGDNTIFLEQDPIVIDTQSFCVGFATFDWGLAGALGVAVDEGSTVEDVSFYRINGEDGCEMPSFVDVIDAQPIPTGNWCVGAIVHDY